MEVQVDLEMIVGFHGRGSEMALSSRSIREIKAMLIEFVNPCHDLVPRSVRDRIQAQYSDITFAEYCHKYVESPTKTLQKLTNLDMTIDSVFSAWEADSNTNLLGDIGVRSYDFKRAIEKILCERCRVCGRYRDLLTRGKSVLLEVKVGIFDLCFSLNESSHRDCDIKAKREDVIFACIQDVLDRSRNEKASLPPLAISTFSEWTLLQEIEEGRYSYRFAHMLERYGRLISYCDIEVVESGQKGLFFKLDISAARGLIVSAFSLLNSLLEYQYEFLLAELSDKIDVDLEISLVLEDELRDIITDMSLSIISFTVWQAQRSYLQYREEGVRGNYLLTKTKGALRRAASRNATKTDLEPERYTSFFEIDDSFYFFLKTTYLKGRPMIKELKTLSPKEFCRLVEAKEEHFS